VNHQFLGTGGYGKQVELDCSICSADIDIIGLRNQRLRIQQQLQRQRSCGSRCIDASADLTNCSARAETCTRARSDTCARAEASSGSHSGTGSRSGTGAHLAPRNRN
jgi:hypothetical protein